MAEVFRARPFGAPEFDRLLAVKRILPTLADDVEFTQMFIDEAKIAIRLNHPNIAQIYELGKRGNSHYIVMEYIAGHELLRVQNHFRARGSAMGFAQAAYVVRGLAAALSHAHEHAADDGEPMPVIHRDISPQNVVVSWAGEVKLIDFGIAKVANRSSDTQAGVLKGKFSYMSPEQVTGKTIDPRSDLFAVGTVLHELLTGQRLFAREGDFDTLAAVRAASVEPPSSLNDKVPWPLDNITLKALARDRDKRYQTAQAIEQDLTAFLDGLDPTFDQAAMSGFMIETFPMDLQRERRRRQLYSVFVEPEDVIAHNEKLVRALRTSRGAPAQDQGEPDLSEVEITQVVDADYDRLMSELEQSELERGQAEEVLAESALGSLASLLTDRSNAMLASIDLPEAREREDTDEALFKPHRQRRRGGLLLGLLALIGVALAGAILFGSYRSHRLPPADTRGTLLLESEPSHALQIFVDGRLVGTETPLVARDLDAGGHRLEVRHAAYETHHQTIVVEGGRAVQLELALIALTQGPAHLLLEIDPPDAEVWVDGRFVAGGGSRRRLSLSGRERHLVEVRRAGYYVAERWVRLEHDQRDVLSLALERVVGRLVLRSEPPGSAIVDGVPRGTTEVGLEIDDLDPTVPHHLRIEPATPGFRVYESRLVFDGVGALHLYPTLPRIGDTPSTAEAAIGFLAVATGDRWFRLLVDGHETGLTTPVTPDAPLALRAGVREVTLVRGQEQHVMTVDVAVGSRTAIDCRSSQWECGI